MTMDLIADRHRSMAAMRRSLQFCTSALLLIGGGAGVTIAVISSSWIDPRTLRWFFGAFLAAYAAYLLLRIPTRRWSLSGPFCQTLVGMLGGATGALTAMPGAIPSVWCEMRGLAKEQQLGLVQPFIVGMQLLALLLFAISPVGIPGHFP